MKAVPAANYNAFFYGSKIRAQGENINLQFHKNRSL